MKTIFTALAVLWAGYASATTYYVDASAGSDTAVGTTPGQAWRTIGKVRQSMFQPGDSVLFERGESWQGTALRFPSSGTAGNPITIGAYGTGPKPTIFGATFGIELRGRQFVTVEDFVLRNNTEAGLTLYQGSSGIIVRDVEGYSNGNEAFKQYDTTEASYFNIVGNNNLDDGFSLHDSATAIIHGGYFAGNVSGIQNIGDSQLVADHLTLANNTSYGLNVRGMAEAEVAGVMFKSNAAAIVLHNSSAANIHEAVFTGPGNGVGFSSGAMLDQLDLTFAVPGDVDFDGTVGRRDAALLATNYGRADVMWNHGDFTGDGVVALADWALLQRNLEGPALSPTAIPEPTSWLLTLLFLGGGVSCQLFKRQPAIVSTVTGSVCSAVVV